MKTVCLDLGNTRMKAALFENGELLESHVLESDGVEMLKEIIENHQPEKSILSSVIHHSEEIEKILTEKTKYQWG